LCIGTKRKGTCSCEVEKNFTCIGDRVRRWRMERPEIESLRKFWTNPAYWDPKGIELCDHALDLEARLTQTDGLLRKLYRLDFSKGSRLSMLVEELEEALKGLRKNAVFEALLKQAEEALESSAPRKYTSALKGVKRG